MSAARPVSELMRLACIYAEQDRQAMADADPGEFGKEAAALAKELRAYRLKRWGKTSLETMLEDTTSVEIRSNFP